MRAVCVFAAVLGLLVGAGTLPAARAGSLPSDVRGSPGGVRQAGHAHQRRGGARHPRRTCCWPSRRRAPTGSATARSTSRRCEIARDLGLDTSPGSNTVKNVVAALRYLADAGYAGGRPQVTPPPPPPPPPPVEWERYFDETVNLWNDGGFMGLVQQKGFHPVKISWEDIGRYQSSVWGDRISDVGIWVRKDEGDPRSARLALSVRRDSNFRDKVLVVPAAAIKIHQRVRRAHGREDAARSAWPSWG